MKNFLNFKAVLPLAFCLISILSFGQNNFTADALINAIAKPAESQEVSDLKASYHFEMANENHYLSKEGIELVLQNGTLNEIRLYKESPVYGSFKGPLPKRLNFSMNSADVKKALGKPSVSYNTGYCEFEIQGQVISCWFEKDRLSQVDLGSK